MSGPHDTCPFSTTNALWTLSHCAPGTRITTPFPYTALFRSLDGLRAPGARRGGGAPAARVRAGGGGARRAEEHTSELQSPYELVCRLLLEEKKHIETIVLDQLLDPIDDRAVPEIGRAHVCTP